MCRRVKYFDDFATMFRWGYHRKFDLSKKTIWRSVYFLFHDSIVSFECDDIGYYLRTIHAVNYMLSNVQYDLILSFKLLYAYICSSRFESYDSI